MSYAGEFHIAHTDEAQVEVINYFMESDYKSLLIIDQYLHIFNIKEQRGDHNCFVVFLDKNSNPELEPKIIYIHEAFDDLANEFMINKGGLLAFF
jgi:hypothetical protein